MSSPFVHALATDQYFYANQSRHGIPMPSDFFQKKEKTNAMAKYHRVNAIRESENVSSDVCWTGHSTLTIKSFKSRSMTGYRKIVMSPSSKITTFIMTMPDSKYIIEKMWSDDKRSRIQRIATYTKNVTKVLEAAFFAKNIDEIDLSEALLYDEHYIMIALWLTSGSWVKTLILPKGTVENVSMVEATLSSNWVLESLEFYCRYSEPIVMQRARVLGLDTVIFGDNKPLE